MSKNGRFGKIHQRATKKMFDALLYKAAGDMETANLYANKAFGMAKTYGGFTNVEKRAAEHFNLS